MDRERVKQVYSFLPRIPGKAAFRSGNGSARTLQSPTLPTSSASPTRDLTRSQEFLVIGALALAAFAMNLNVQVMAALNLKNHVQVRVEQCLLRDNEICFRLRGVTGKRGGALVTIEDCAVYRSKVAVRMEDRIRDLKITRLGIGDGVRRTFRGAGGGAGPGFENTGAYEAPPFEQLLKTGFSTSR